MEELDCIPFPALSGHVAELSFSFCELCGHVAELVYAYVSEAYGATRGSSSLPMPTQLMSAPACLEGMPQGLFHTESRLYMSCVSLYQSLKKES